MLFRKTASVFFPSDGRSMDDNVILIVVTFT